MVARWISALLGIALIQGSLGISPIYAPDVADEEWASFAVQLRDVAYRLPTTTMPRHYEVSLTPYFDNVAAGITPFSFDGNVVIYLSPTETNVNEIIMHCDDLVISSFSLSTIVNGIETNVATNGVIPTCEMPYAFMRITPTAVLNLNQEYIVRMSFTGNLQTDMRGFYRSWYFDNTGLRWMATTQFQPGHARKAFPCYDEPGFKATFDITINREAGFSPTISNTPIRETVTLANGRIAETFNTTPKTSTYLVAFIVSHYSRIATTTSLTRPFDIYARANAGTTGDFALEIGELLLEAMEGYTNISYYGMADNLDMKQAAIPDFSAGAMENWGLLTYREALILYDPLNSNHFYRQRVANIISHEITHMWFGNLVTCAWWDNLWLNEGFARLYQHYLTHMVAPEMGFDIRFIVEQLQVVLLSDSIDTAHPLTNDVWDPVTVSAHFSTITYAKGASIIRMTEHLLGSSTYLAGIRSYLNERQFDVAEPQHLFDALDAAAAADGALSAYPGITISEYFKTWSEKGGHPLLTVNVDHNTGLMTVVQARWERTTGQSQFPSLWHVPVTWTRGGAPDFSNLKPSQVLTEQVTVINRGTVGYEWVLFNKQESGFYRVNYDDNTWALITRALRGSERTTIHEINRAQIVDDVFALSRAGVMSYRKALNILSFLEFEDAYAPWYSAITGFNWVLRRLAHDDANLQRLKDEIIRLSVAITNRLGYTEVANEPYMDGLLRMYLMEFLCDVEHPQCVQAGVANYQNWLSGTFIPANMRSWVYCEGLRAGDSAEYTALWNHFVQEELASETTMILSVLGCTRNTTHLWDYLNQIVTDNYYIRPQDYAVALNGAVSGNEANTMAAFEWLQNNVAPTTAALGSISTPLSYIVARLLNEQQIAVVQTWLDANAAVIGTTAYNTGVSGIQTVRTNLAWSAARLPEMVQYFNEGFVDLFEELEVETDPTPEIITTTTPAAPIDVTDSANFVVLNVFVLLVALCANLM